MSTGVFVYLLVTGFAAAASIALAIRIWDRRRVPGARMLALMMVGAANWCVATLGELLAGNVDGKIIWAKLGYVAIVSIPATWLAFSLIYAGVIGKDAWRPIVGLAIIPVVTLVLVALSPGVPGVWSAVWMLPAPGAHPLQVTHAPWFWVNMTYCYVCLLAGSALVLTVVLKRVKALTKQGITIALAVQLPWLANLVTILKVLPLGGLDLTGPATFASGALIAFALFKLQALDVYPGLVPVARDAVFHGMQDGVLVVDVTGRVLDANRAAERMLCATEGTLPGRRLTGLLAVSGELLAPDCDEWTACRRSFETTVPDGSGAQRFLDVVVSGLGSSAESSGQVLVMRDVTERKLLEGEMRHRALHDELTQLPNRALIREQLDELILLRKREGGSISLLMIDIDRFKEINDTLGHEAGDALLRAVAGRLREELRESDLVARLGGDEFAVVLPACDAAGGLDVARRLREQLLEPFDLFKREVCVSVSIGVTECPTHGRDVGTLLRHADVALYLAKDAAQGIAIYQASRDFNSPARLELLNDLRAAIHGHKLVLHYQPEIDILTGEIVRLEALARWPQPDGRMIPPGEFIPLAEQNGLIPSLTTWSLGEALRQCAVWQAAGRTLDVAVNLSALDLRDPELARRVAQALRDAGVDAERLWVEVTETAVMSDPQEAMNVLTELRQLGVRVAIDDFGVGQSSLSYIRRLPATEVKIDQTFVRDVATQPRDAAIVRAAVALAHELGLTVTAEGIETAEALGRLRELGCDHGQGFFLARPMPESDVLDWLATAEQPARPAPSHGVRDRIRPASLASAPATLP
jgi:diguanylate cyclase (GGDEF)-like protein/PAS domain S-box-containing protein